MTTRPVGSGVKGKQVNTRRPWTAEELARVRAMRADGCTIAAISRATDRSFSSIENILTKSAGQMPLTRPHDPAPMRSGREFTVSDGGQLANVLTTTHEPVRTLDDLATVCEIDLTVWDVVEWTANAWESSAKDADGRLIAKTLHQVKARLRRKAYNPSAVADGILDALRAKVKPLRPLQRTARTSGYLYVATMGEPHLGKMAWAPETGESYDLSIALDRIRTSHRHLMQRAAVLEPERIALIVGDDFFTADNPGNTTTAGTPQEVDGRYRKVFRAGVALCREIIESWRQIAPVDVWVKVGNHDQTITWHAGEVLAAIYANTDDVTVVNPDRLRHYQQWGRCLIGLTHGDKEKDDKLPLLMASEAKDAWAETTCRVWLCGHLHTLKAKTQRAVVQPMGADVHEEMGVTVRRLRSLSGTDAWHFALGYVGNLKGAEGFAFHKVHGETDIHAALQLATA